MKKILSSILAGSFVVGSLSIFNCSAQETDPSLWDKFLKYDLCISDYSALTNEEKELCRFIFDTEQAANDNIICERARRTLAGDDNIGSRITLEQLDSASGIWDNYIDEVVYRDQTYIHCVPDVIRLGTESDDYSWKFEYWLDDSRSKYVVYNQRVDTEYIESFDVFDKNDELIETVPVTACDLSYPELRNNEEFIEKLGFIEKNNGYYYIKNDGTAVFAWYKFSDATRRPILKQNNIAPIAEPFTIESEINGCPVTAIDNSAFVNSPLKEIIIPNSVEYINCTAFVYCTYLEKINLPRGLKYLGPSAFLACDSLSEMSIDCPNIKLQNRALFSCNNLRSIELNVSEIDENSLPKSLESIKLGNDLKKIGFHAFTYCKKLKSLELPTGTELISQGAFIFSKMNSVTIPPTVRLIGAYPRKTGYDLTIDMDYTPIRPLTDKPICAFDSECVIKGYKGTEAERYANEWGMEFVALGYTKGDVNFDNSFTVADVVTLQNWLVTKPDSKLTYWKAADLNDDDILDVFDLIAMKKALIVTE